MRKKLLRLLRIAPLALLLVGVASAQTTGTIIGVVTDAQTGKPVVGALVIATSPNLQGEQTVVTDKSGAFRVQALPPGGYKLAVQIDGFKPAERSDIDVRIDKTIRANLQVIPEAVQMEEQVVKTAAAPVINVGSAETGAVVSREFTSNIPTSRGFQQVALVAPTATVDQYGISFAGTTSPENNYVLDGLSVTNPSLGGLGSQVLNNFVQELDVKTGAFMPEYGFASGGLVSVVTKSGSNEFHGSLFGNYQPGALRPTALSTGRSGEALTMVRDNQSAQTYLADFGFEVGGPIMKDKLWFYAGIAPNLDRSIDDRVLTAHYADGSSRQLSSQPFTNKNDQVQYVGKLTYLFNENNSLTVTGIYAPTQLSGVGNRVTPDANGALSTLWRESQQSFGDAIARYSSKLLDKRLLVEAVAGWHHQDQNAKPVTYDGVNQAEVGITQWANTHPLSDFVAGLPAACNDPAGGSACNVTNYTTGGRGNYDVKNARDRFSGKVAGTYLFDFFGSHQAKAGIEIQRTDFLHTKAYGGNAFLVETTLASPLSSRYNPAVITPLPQTVLIQNRGYGVVASDRQSFSATPFPSITSTSTSQAYFAQDSYSPVDGLTLNAGVRWEVQHMGANAPDAPSFNIADNIGPRLQAVYDWTKQGKSKVSVNWGRFYENVPLDLGDRAFGLEQGLNVVRQNCVSATLAGADKSALGSATAGPQSCAPIINAYRSAAAGIYTYRPTGSSAEPVAPNLKGQYSDTFGGALEYEVLPDLSVGFDYTGRRIGSIIEDMSTDDGETYFIANPGTGSPFDGGGFIVDPKNAVASDPVTGITYNTKFPKPVRDYDAFTFSVRKTFSNKWQAIASYTYSSLRGNYPGLFKADTGQLDPNLTSMFDLVSLLSNQTGPLPQDIPHQVKLFSSYTFDFGSRLAVTAGGALRAQSGVPVNFLGAHPLYGQSEGYVLPRGSGGRTPFDTNVDLRGAVSYVVKAPYALKFSVDLLNVFNSQTAQTVDENWTFDSVNPVIGGQCSARNAASKSDKVGAALAQCPALNYLKTTDGRPATINGNWGQPLTYRPPLAVRFGLELSF
jgi:hypothetical protein